MGFLEWRAIVRKLERGRYKVMRHHMSLPKLQVLCESMQDMDLRFRQLMLHFSSYRIKRDRSVLRQPLFFDHIILVLPAGTLSD